MSIVGGRSPIAVLALSQLPLALSGCDAFAAVELRCAAFFHQLSEADIFNGDTSKPALYRQHAMAFVDRLPGDRADNIEKMRSVGGAIMADDGLYEECKKSSLCLTV